MRFFAVLATLAGAWGCAPRPAPSISGTMPQEVYIWQRSWGAPVRKAIGVAQSQVAGFVPLAAEVAWKGKKRVLIEPALDFAALKASGRPVGMALRIGAFAGPFSEDDDTARGLGALARSLLEKAAAAGMIVSELQVDFDCAASRLDGYRLWLKAIKKAAAPVPVAITVLPSWLGQKQFGALAREAGRYVLQVHSVEAPRAGTKAELCNPLKARRWAEAADKIGVPFRVALPTYTYLVAFGKDGALLGISAEGPPAAWPEDVRLQTLPADALELSALVQAWTKSRPARLEGLIWYRLPVSSDSMNWRWATLSAILAGRTPGSALRVEAGDSNPSDVILINDGELDAPLPPLIQARWQDARLLAGDALGGFFSLERGEAKDRAHFRGAASTMTPRLPPGERRVIGWLRLEPPSKIHVTIPEN